MVGSLLWQTATPITVLDAAKKQHRIRLAGIDAPERGQPFGSRSREYLAKWIHRQDVVVDWHKRDRYGRIIGIVIAFGHDIGLEQVRGGMAWWYRAYAHEQTAEDRLLYELAEDEARAAKRGLWSEGDPIPPWDWRRTRGREKAH
jgi:endonuclease YncB( thermonuclease family)